MATIPVTPGLFGTVLHTRDIVRLWYGQGRTDAKELALVAAVMWGESDLFTEAVGQENPDGTQDFGVFQLNSSHQVPWGFATLDDFIAMAYDPEQAVKFAVKLFLSGGITQWQAYNNASYKQFLYRAVVGVANFLGQAYGIGTHAVWAR